jgi:hypothetical protein
MLDTLHDIDKDETLAGKEKSAAKGGAVGGAAGSIAGAAGGASAGGVLAAMATAALAGTAIGTAIPGLGNIAGLIIGAGIGAAGYYFGGKAGRGIGAGIGGAVAGDGAGSLDAAQKNYEEALNDAADTVGKTAEEIEAARIKLVEAEARRENAVASEKKKSAYEELAAARADEYSHRGGNPQTVQAASDAAYNYGGYEYRGYRRPVNDLIVTPQGQFSTHPDDYILAMKNPAALVNAEASLPGGIRNEVRTIERVPPALPPVVVEGAIELRSELVIDDKGYRLRQAVGKNTTPYKFSVGNAQAARLI